MKKTLAITVLALTLATGCASPDGDVYISFDWTYTPEWFDTDDSNLPDTIYRNAEYVTGEGDYYFEYYHAESGYIRWIWYTLTAHDGVLPFVPGEDARFELFLSAFSDPAFIQWQSSTGAVSEEPDSITASASPRQPEDQRVQTFEQTLTSAGWTLSIRGGVIEAAAR
ncbi:MAG: hypothetical protein NTU62_11980 [Spirochaetes bacterium]|nr:hypothetical protein [Spirochaetota bacterium]